MSSQKRPSSSAATDDSAKKKRALNKVDSQYDDASADLVLVSSDLVHFRVHSYLLRSMSPVFRDMIADCASTSNEIKLTDDKIERASALRCLLRLAEGMTPADFDLPPCSTVYATILLAKKYETKAITQTISNLVARVSPDLSRSNPRNRFFYACLLDDVDIAHHYFAGAAATRFRETAVLGPAGYVAGASALDPTAMSISDIEAIPPKYFYAILRAWRVRIASPQGSWQEVADEFKKQVKLQEK